jgi:hypothetical protein
MGHRILHGHVAKKHLPAKLALRLAANGERMIPEKVTRLKLLQASRGFNVAADSGGRGRHYMDLFRELIRSRSAVPFRPGSWVIKDTKRGACLKSYFVVDSPGYQNSHRN